MSMQDHTVLLNHLHAQRQASTLALPYASLTHIGMEDIGKFMAESSHIKTLDLRGNLIQSKGAIELANGIRVNRSLRNLILKGNAIGKDSTGIAALCSAFKSNFQITHADFRNNSINNVGARHIGDMLMHNSTITHLDLSWNDFGLDGGLHILEGLKHNTTLVDCQLSGSKCGEDTVHEVAFLLRRNRSTAAYKVGGPSADSHAYGARTVDATLSSTQSRDLLCRATPSSLYASPRVVTSPLASSVATMYSPRNHTKARLRLKQGEVFSPDDRHFYGKVSDHLDQLEAEVKHHRQNIAQTELRERTAAASFAEREQHLKSEIALHNDKISQNTAEKSKLEQDVLRQKSGLQALKSQHERAIRDNVALQQQTQSEEQELRRQLDDVSQTKRNLQDELARHNSDLDNLRAENGRLRTHVMSFQENVHNILAC